MNMTNIGTEETTKEDRGYRGSRFAEVRDAIFTDPYQKVWGAEGEPPMPRYEVTLLRFLRGALPFGEPFRFRQAVERTVDSHADLRWGSDRTGFLRLLHPNGICMTGLWKITEESEYSGYFSKGSQALTVGRYSTCCTETRRGHTRSLALVGKLFPTTDPSHAEPLRTANFFTQQDLGGDHTDYINDAETRNAPDTRAWRRGLGLPILLITGATFLRVDREPTNRQLYEIAELGQPKGEPTRTPKFMRLRVATSQPRIEGKELDFRDEIMAQIYDKGDSKPKRSLTFHIEVTDQASTLGTTVFEKRIFKDWRPLGTLTFDNAVASPSGDRVIHFHHPSWRTDPDDPATATRQNERKVR